MKTNLICMLTALVMLATYAELPAQTYESIFGQNQTTWSISYCQLNVLSSLDRIAMEDTIIATIPYKKVGTVHGSHTNYSMSSSGEKNGFIREDTSTGKIWFMAVTNDLSNIDTVEHLVADLALSLGDSFTVHKLDTDSIVFVDSVYYQSGKKHIRLDYIHETVSDSAKLTFIEGVGTNVGFGYMHTNLNGPTNLCECLMEYKKDSNNVYINQHCQSSANPISSVKQEVFEVKLFPNPARQHLKIEFDNPSYQKVILKVYDVNGMAVYQAATQNNYFELGAADFQGFYFYELKLDGQNVARGKFLFLGD